MIIKKLDSEGPTRRAVQARLNSRPTATTRREGKNRIILQVVCTYVGIAVVIVCDAAMAIKRDVEVDPETAIRKNGVTQNGITDRIGTTYYYSCIVYIARGRHAIESHNVACARRRPTNDTGRSIDDVNARCIP